MVPNLFSGVGCLLTKPRKVAAMSMETEAMDNIALGFDEFLRVLQWCFVGWFRGFSGRGFYLEEKTQSKQISR